MIKTLGSLRGVPDLDVDAAIQQLRVSRIDVVGKQAEDRDEALWHILVESMFTV